jgi:hypothetical protein
MMELGVDGTFKRRLKPDATPNVPLASPIAFGFSVVAPKRCTGHHLELLAILPTWMFVLVC